MLLSGEQNRQLRLERIEADLAIVGGGIAGVCAAITAAREGLNVALVQDRPVLGGNASSEVRLWMVGATSHMGNNNRWAREGGVLNEILLENAYRNPEGNPVLFDAVLLDKVVSEPGIRLLLNTSVFEADTTGANRIKAVRAFNSQNSTRYEVTAPLFCDASGDGVLGFLAGAPFRIGVESQAEFGELLAPESANRELLGHSIYFYTRDTGEPVSYVPPSYALTDITSIPRFKRFNTKEQGTDLWWIEYGGSLDTVHETETIKWELWKIIYGVWHHIKNSGDFTDAETLTLDWVGLIPGKRESRRFEGDYMLVQQDVVEQRSHPDAVSFGGWAIDHHPVDNIYSEGDPCTQWHGKGVYQIPYRTMFSRGVPNLFLAGRLISVSHVAFGSSRVMATCGHNAQAVGMAAAICHEQGAEPSELAAGDQLNELQTRLLRVGQHIPALARVDAADLAQSATVTASSFLQRLALPPTDSCVLSESRALLLPVEAGAPLNLAISAESDVPTMLTAELRTCSRAGSFSPDVLLEQVEAPLRGRAAKRHGKERVLVAAGSSVSGRAMSHRRTVARPAAVPTPEGGGIRFDPSAANGAAVDDSRAVRLPFETEFTKDQYVFVCLRENRSIRIGESDAMVTGVTSVRHASDAKVSRKSRQSPPVGIGIDEMEFWTPRRRPAWRNLAVTAELAPSLYAPSNVANGVGRPTSRPNAWVASPSDPKPRLTLRWDSPQRLSLVEVVLDPDWDHPMESVVMRHAERVMPTLVRRLRLLREDGSVLASVNDNHQAIVRCRLAEPVTLSSLVCEVEHPSDHAPASVFEVRCYRDA